MHQGLDQYYFFPGSIPQQLPANLLYSQRYNWLVPR
jgi:hypothetical protein